MELRLRSLKLWDWIPQFIIIILTKNVYKCIRMNHNCVFVFGIIDFYQMYDITKGIDFE